MDYGWIMIFLTSGLGIAFLVLQSLQPLPWLDLNYDPRWVFQLSDQTTYNYDSLNAAKTQLLHAMYNNSNNLTRQNLDWEVIISIESIFSNTSISPKG